MVTAKSPEVESFHMQKKQSPAKQKPKDERTQRERFEQFAREHGATENVLEKALGDVAKARSGKNA